MSWNFQRKFPWKFQWNKLQWNFHASNVTNCVPIRVQLKSNCTNYCLVNANNLATTRTQVTLIKELSNIYFILPFRLLRLLGQCCPTTLIIHSHFNYSFFLIISLLYFRCLNWNTIFLYSTLLFLTFCKLFAVQCSVFNAYTVSSKKTYRATLDTLKCINAP